LILPSFFARAHRASVSDESQIPVSDNAFQRLRWRGSGCTRKGGHCGYAVGVREVAGQAHNDGSRALRARAGRRENKPVETAVIGPGLDQTVDQGTQQERPDGPVMESRAGATPTATIAATPLAAIGLGTSWAR